MDVKYRIEGWYRHTYFLTAEEIYERVLKDSEFDYNWLIPVAELVRVCNDSNFPKDYARKIKIAILNRFAHLELQKEFSAYGKEIANAAVYNCYYSLNDEDEEVKRVKRKYVEAIIGAVVKYDHDEVRFPFFEPEYVKRCEEWKKKKFDEYFSKEKIDFESMERELHLDFDNMFKYT